MQTNKEVMETRLYWLMNHRGSQFSFNDVKVVTTTIWSGGSSGLLFCCISRLSATKWKAKYHRIETKIEVGWEEHELDLGICPSPAIRIRYHAAEDEIALCTGGFLWDYLRRLILLSGVSTLVSLLWWFCQCVDLSLKRAKPEINKYRRCQAHRQLHRSPPFYTARTIQPGFAHCVQSISNQSSKETRSRAKNLSKVISSGMSMSIQ